MTPQEQAEHDEAIRQRQAWCSHKFIKGIADREAHCVHCGLPETWAGAVTFAGHYSP